MFSQKPDLELVRAQDAAHEKIVRAVVPVVGRGPCCVSVLPDHGLVGFEKPCQLTRPPLPGPRGGRETRVISTMSAAIAMLTPPNSWMRSAISARSFTFYS
jgi:hypothetical protein